MSNNSTDVFLSKNALLFSFSLLATLAIFIADYFTPLGVAVSVLYLFVILKVSFIRNIKYVFFFAFLTTFLCGLGFFLSPVTADLWKAITNRSISILSIWSVVFLNLKLLRTLDLSESLNRALREKKNFLERSRKASLNLLDDTELAKNQALQAKSHAEQIIESTPNGMIIINKHGSIVAANKFTKQLLGYDPESLLNYPFEMLVPKRYLADLPIGKYFKSTEFNPRSPVEKQEIHCVRKDGTEVPVELAMNPVEMEEDSFALASIVDISERKLSEKKLRDTNRQLKRVNRELSNFAYITSHDLQEPLRSISSFLQLLKSDYCSKLDETANEYIDFAVGGASRLQGMIRSLLHYSRIDSRDIVFEKLDLNVPLQSAQENLFKLIEDTGTTIDASELPRIYGDSAQIIQLFQNFISNSIKFRSEAPRISITAKIVSGSELPAPYLPDSKFCTVRVSDNGIGINPQYHDRIFKIFQRLHSGDTYSGHGIGLALCNKIVHLHGGQIWIESEEGKGCSFSFSLPMQPPAIDS